MASGWGRPKVGETDEFDENEPEPEPSIVPKDVKIKIKVKMVKKSRYYESFCTFMYKILKQVHPEARISGKAMGIMNNFTYYVTLLRKGKGS